MKLRITGLLSLHILLSQSILGAPVASLDDPCSVSLTVNSNYVSNIACSDGWISASAVVLNGVYINFSLHTIGIGGDTLDSESVVWGGMFPDVFFYCCNTVDILSPDPTVHFGYLAPGQYLIQAVSSNIAEGLPCATWSEIITIAPSCSISNSFPGGLPETCYGCGDQGITVQLNQAPAPAPMLPLSAGSFSCSINMSVFPAHDWPYDFPIAQTTVGSPGSVERLGTSSVGDFNVILQQGACSTSFPVHVPELACSLSAAATTTIANGPECDDGTIDIAINGNSIGYVVSLFDTDTVPVIAASEGGQWGPETTSSIFIQGPGAVQCSWSGLPAGEYLIAVSTSPGGCEEWLSRTIACSTTGSNGLNFIFDGLSTNDIATFTLLDEDNNVVCTGTTDGNLSNGSSLPCSLPDGRYRLRVTDQAGDGLATGGYSLRTTSGQRIIDNTGGTTSGPVSAIANNADFGLPLGGDVLIASSCDKLDWVANRFIVASANPAVSGQFGVTNATSGYEFWFFDPNGTYSYRRFRSHATSDGFGSGATRACHFKVNGWINGVSTPHLPSNVLLNVRVRGRVAGTNLEFGPACQFKLDPVLAACPRIKLQDDPTNTADFSCGVFRNFGGSSNPNNRLTATPPQPVPAVASSAVRYQFRFQVTAENICIVRPPQTSPRLILNWTTGEPLVCGKTYEVDVRVSLNGGVTWCTGPVDASPASACADPNAWGKVCLVTMNPCASSSASSSNIALENATSFTIHPNPNRGDQFFLTVDDLEEDLRTVEVEILDMTGKSVMARRLAAQDGRVRSTVDLEHKLPRGMYMVISRFGASTLTKRMVVE